MRRVQVYIELSDVEYRHYEEEGRRHGVTVETLVHKMIQGLVQEMQREEREGTDHPIISA